MKGKDFVEEARGEQTQGGTGEIEYNSAYRSEQNRMKSQEIRIKCVFHISVLYHCCIHISKLHFRIGILILIEKAT